MFFFVTYLPELTADHNKKNVVLTLDIKNVFGFSNKRLALFLKIQ